jgi:hypothetical protein
MFVLALAGGETHLISLALIGVGLTWMTLRRETFVAEYEHGWQNEPTQTCVVGCCAPSETEVEDEEADIGTDEVEEPDPMRRAERHQPTAAHGTGRCMPQGASKPPVAPSDSDLDAILAKISSSGMASLTETERETLRKATEAKRKT